MTFNIRYDNPNDGVHAWPHREKQVANLIPLLKVDIVGLQEALRHQVEAVAGHLSEYKWFGVGRTDGKDSGEFAPLFYLASRLEVREKGTFWLSETPDSIGSRGWDAALERIATWGRFKDISSGNEFLVINTHFDHRGKLARYNSVQVLRRKIDSLPDSLPVILLGDFNFQPESSPYAAMTGTEAGRRLLKDSFHSKNARRYGPAGTFTGFRFEADPARRIDYIFTAGPCVVSLHAVIAEVWQNRPISDHRPVLIDFSLP